MRFGCFSFFYFSLKSQFNAARLSVFNNTWSDVYDFSPASDNFAFLSHQGSKDLHSRFLTLAAAAPDHFSIEELSMSSQAEVVPFTLGKSATLQADTFLLLFPPSLNEAAKVTVSRLASSTDHVFSLALSREVILTQDHLAMLFAGSRENRHPSKWCCGPSIGLQIIGGSFSSFAGHLNEVAGASVNDVFGTDDSAVIKVFFERLPEQV
jgi:protein XRP2